MQELYTIYSFDFGIAGYLALREMIYPHNFTNNFLQEVIDKKIIKG